VQNDLLVFSAHQMVDDMRSRSIASGIAEPLGADQAFDNGSWRVNATVTDIKYQRLSNIAEIKLSADLQA